MCENSLINTTILALDLKSSPFFSIKWLKHDYNLTTLKTQWSKPSAKVPWTKDFQKAQPKSHAKLMERGKGLQGAQSPLPALSKSLGEGTPVRPWQWYWALLHNQTHQAVRLPRRHSTWAAGNRGREEWDTQVWQNRKFEETISEMYIRFSVTSIIVEAKILSVMVEGGSLSSSSIWEFAILYEWLALEYWRKLLLIAPFTTAYHSVLHTWEGNYSTLYHSLYCLVV